MDQNSHQVVVLVLIVLFNHLIKFADDSSSIGSAA